MYAWIWRHLPFGLPGKLTGSLLLASGVVALLWFVVFPWADPFIEQNVLPWNDGQLEGDFAPTGGDPAAPVPTAPAETGGPLPGDHDIPYDTDG